MPTCTHPRFFSFDGVDGAGKSTQIARFCAWLRERGTDVVECRDPGGTELSERIRELLLGNHGFRVDRVAEMLLYMAARAQLVEERIGPALAAGKTVVSDRYLLSNVVYQGYALGLDVAEIKRVGELATGGLSPGLTFVLDLSPEGAQARMGRELDRMESRGADFQRRVREGYLAEARLDPERVAVIDAAQPVEAVQEAIRERYLLSTEQGR